MPQGLFAKLVKERPKEPAEVLAKAVAALQSLETLGREHGEKEQAQVRRYLGYLKFLLFGDEQGSGPPPTKDSVLALVRQVVRTDFQLLLVQNLPLLEFEARKDAAQVFGAIVRIRDDASDPPCPGAQYVLQHNHILYLLFDGYDSPTIALNCGSMYRDCIRDEAIAREELYSSHFMDFFDRVEVANFEIASDAFSSFKDLLTRHKKVVAQFLSDRYGPFFEAYERLLKSSNYVTRRQSLKLLSELLMARNNLKLMLDYVSEPQNLMQMMNMLKDSSRSIQFEAFHVFKVFVANPNKPQPIIDILTNNRDKLLKYLEDFHTDKDDDEQFKEEKAVVIKEISMLGSQQAKSRQQQQAQQQQQQQAAAAAPPPLPADPQAAAPPGAAGGDEAAAAAGVAAQAQQPELEQQQQQQLGGRSSSSEGVS